MYTLTYIGMDRLEQELEYGNLPEAKEAKTWIEERGGHSITICDPDGNEVE